jgi:predicted flap endonuclease-1-like 5' DNA nuclease
MAYSIQDIEGIGSAYGERLSAIGINSTEDLLANAGSKSGRKSIAEKTEIPEPLILTWVNHADLMRINGVAGQFSELLEAAGVDTVKEFAQRNAENLHIKLAEVNREFGLTGKVPSVESLSEMIAQAKKLDQKVFY